MPPNVLGSVAVIPISQGAVFEWDPVYVDSVAYLSGDAVGAKVALPLPSELVGKIVVVQSCTAVFAEQSGFSYNLAVLNEDYTDPGDNAPFSLADADVAKVVDVRSLSSSFSLGPTAGVGIRKDPVPVLVNAKSANLWVQLIVYGAPTFAAVGKIRIRLGVALA